MKVTVENKKNLEKNLKVFVDKTTINKELELRYEQIKKDVVLKGFRPGKVPTDIIKKQFGKAVYGEVLSSEWCRCKDTSFYAFSNYRTFSGLNSFYDPKFYKNKKKQIKNLKKFIKNWDGKSNLILVTHYVVILEMLNLGANSGEIIVTNKDYKTLGRIKID